MDEQADYRIVILGELSQKWLDWFDNLAIELSRGPGDMPLATLSGTVPDQAALRGILCKLWDLNLTVISVVRLDA